MTGGSRGQCVRGGGGSEGVSGAWVTAASGQTPDVIMCVTDPVAEQLAELQLTSARDQADAQGSAAPVLAADLEADEPSRGGPRSRREPARSAWVPFSCSR